MALNSKRSQIVTQKLLNASTFSLVATQNKK